MFVRAAVALVAVIVIAWLAVIIRDAQDLNQGTLQGVVDRLHTPSGLSKQVDRLRAGEFLNPDTAPELQIAMDYEVRSAPGDLDHALRIAESVAIREPQSVAAWLAVYRIQGYRHDTAGRQAAFAHILRLDPLAPDGF